ncbi:MAG: family 16 glycosylhydrolase [Hyphomonadaceae bacterium]
MADNSRRQPNRLLFWPLLLLWLLILILGYFALPREKPLAQKQSHETYVSGESFVSWFGLEHDDEGWYRSDFDNVDHFMQVGWAVDHIGFGAEGMSLKLSDQDSPTNRHTSGEYQRRGRYGFGRYEVIMRAPVGSGLVTSFFTHTGPYFGDPHDEIDFEILGKNTRRIYLNWFTDGKVGQAVWHELGFDATKEFHHYAFEWEPDAIRWYIDGEQVYERPEGTTPVPQTPGRIIANLWTGTRQQYKWHGVPAFTPPVEAAYQCMSFRRLDDAETPTCADGWEGFPKSVTPKADHDAVSAVEDK